jgi:hypothetical protein
MGVRGAIVGSTWVASSSLIFVISASPLITAHHQGLRPAGGCSKVSLQTELGAV